MADISKKAAEEFLSLTLLEAGELKTILKDEYGIEPAAGGAVMMAGPAMGSDSGVAEEEASEFVVILKSAGTSKINVIKEVRAITGLGLKEAKDLVEAGDKAVKEGASKAESEEIKARLLAQGAEAEIVAHGAADDFDEYSNTVAWVAADWLSLGREAKRRSKSLNDTLQYVQRVCQKVQKV